jgi:hypothetical protein
MYKNPQNQMKFNKILKISDLIIIVYTCPFSAEILVH